MYIRAGGQCWLEQEDNVDKSRRKKLVRAAEQHELKEDKLLSSAFFTEDQEDLIILCIVEYYSFS
jgi:hypothetical protein